MPYERELQVARAAALRAGESALRYWKAGCETETKLDDSPVTAADREAERIITGVLTDAFPDDGMLGEEGAARDGSSGRRWIIDPVDGTRDFVRRTRFWSVQLALEESENHVVAGVVHFPALEETYYAARGAGAFCSGSPIRVSDVTEPSQAVLCVNDLGRFRLHPFGARFIEWVAQFWSVRNPGGSPDAVMVASGKADAWLEPHSEVWDLAPHKILIEEAGGVFRNFDGGSSIYGGNCITCTPALERMLLEFVQGQVSR